MDKQLEITWKYGTVGNDISSSTRFLYLTTMNMNVSAGYMGKEGNNYMAGIMEGQTGNQNVTWETAKKLNVGLIWVYLTMWFLCRWIYLRKSVTVS